jgi:23S rRNA pseudouridine1911/1915/1917 synthase
LSIKETDSCIFLAGSRWAGERIDKFLSEKLEDLSRSRIQKLVSAGKVLVGGATVAKNYRLSDGDRVEIAGLSIEEGAGRIEPEDIELDIRYEDEAIIILSKKAGMLTHPAPGSYSHTLVNALLNYSSSISGFSGKERAGIVHRLDRDTSGLLIVAKNERVHHILSEMFSKRKVKKTYIALVEGRIDEEEGVIELPIGRSRIDRKKMAVSIDRGRRSKTEFKPVESLREATLLNVYPRTGRTHQIRVHMSYIGHPVIGDAVYGNKNTARVAERIGLKRQFLHAAGIEFAHPLSGKKMIFSDGLPEDLSGPLEILREEEKI